MTENQEERLVSALERLEQQLENLTAIIKGEFQKQHLPKNEPKKREAKEPTITYIPSDEERLKEEQGTTGEPTTAEWLSLGPRERAFVEKERNATTGDPLKTRH